MNESLDIVTVDGNRKPGDRKIYLHFLKVNFIYPPYMKDIYHWLQLKAKVEENNFPQEEGKQGKEYLRKFVNAAIDLIPWDEAYKKFGNNKMKP